ncbi:uncharacterized protein LOC110983663 [Acanthaster planci]|uniref:Uncharacterized protein LOC110983663 n=1 Tax=Acanthaster planci TaxID=133434 RepID=A0A8B7Z1Y6_ACAPL|nr:uncharacterized protein LOC110983663 [Acanthaster planci]
MRALCVAVLVGVLFTCMTGSHACSCQRNHPQDQFCRSEFVVKASVVSRQYIYKPTPQPVTEPAPESSSEYSSSVLDEEGNLTEVQGPAELQNRPLAELQNRPPAGLLAPIAMNDFPPSTREDNRPIKLEYTIKVEKVFKGDNYLLERTLAKIYTAPYESLCGLVGLTNDISYIIAGSFYNNELRFGLCSWVVPYKSLPRTQRRGVKLMFKKTCGDCTIGSCYGATCKFVPQEDNRCMVDISMMGNSCEEQHSFCARSRKACKWQRNRDYKQCLSSTP